ncbi:MAG: HNH endonuclease [Paludibacteraceae bacterium]|nr:HNH endonuclease [Paludibacteraceae bacterium]MCK9615969.1 HNH endonuclease [Candidatus Omnitrophota bacterium]
MFEKRKAYQIMPYMLNKNWQVIKKITVSKAIKKVLNGRAMFLNKETGELFEYNDWIKNGVSTKTVRFGTGQIPKPEFIVLMFYAGIGMRPIPEDPRISRYNIFVRDEGCCMYCGCKLNWGKGSFTYDHVHPRSRGGKTDWDNIVLSCHACNHKKGDKHLHESGMKLRGLPHKPDAQELRAKSIKMRQQIWKQEDREIAKFF